MKENAITEVIAQLKDGATRDARERGLYSSEYPNRYWINAIIREVTNVVEAAEIGIFADKKKFDKLKKFGFNGAFSICIEHTVEDELADVCIKIFEFMGIRDFLVHIDQRATTHFDEYSCNRDYLDIVDFCFYIIDTLTSHMEDKSLEMFLNYILEEMIAWCLNMDIDLLKYINMKIKYNNP